MCAKKTYKKQSEALSAISIIKKNKSQRDKRPVRAYYCKACSGYHLTSSKTRDERVKFRKKRQEKRFEAMSDKWIKLIT